VTYDEPFERLIAVDIGNSRIKLGWFDRTSPTPLPAPTETLELPIEGRVGVFDSNLLAAWCEAHVPNAADWRIASVHRGAAQQFESTVAEIARAANRQWSLKQLTFRDVPLTIEVDSPERVGIDRLLAAVAADRGRQRNRAAVVVDFGTAITVDLVTAAGAFAGGAILPGFAMSARALERETDALPCVAVEDWRQSPEPLGKATIPAIKSGLFWGAIGAVRELIGKLSASLAEPPEVFVTGGQALLVAQTLSESERWPVRHVPHLVLAGVKLSATPLP
jgi:type III pantothenate kinase